MNRSIRSVGSMSDLAEFFNDTIKSRASDTLDAGKFVANKVPVFYFRRYHKFPFLCKQRKEEIKYAL